ncbi:MAG: outer rane receptor for ferrienterochelin and colicin [Chthoniobacter sp.]|jgi:iron complex outermembrane receptor protein|nr:outer rane receptor for ferrienterochelin and colicin [Chthoniobacter sp.]
MKQQIVLAAGVLALLGSAGLVRGAENAAELTKLKSLSLDEIMQIKIPTVYGASKHEQKITDAPSSVTIVTREEIQIYGHRTLADILRSVRDFYVTDDRHYGSIGVRGVNRPGDYGGRILVLVDGLRLNEPISDGAGVLTDFPIDVDLIERVEVIRGAGSALYGNNAFFAVINVITRTGGDVNGVEASGEIGTFDTYKGRLTYGHVFKGGLSLLLTGTLFESAGNDRLYFAEFDQPVNNHGLAEGRDDDSFASAGLTLSYKDFTLEGGYVSRRKDVPTAPFGAIFNDPNLNTLDQRSFTRLSYAHDFEHDLSVHADVHWNSFYYKGDYPSALDAADPHRATIYRDLADAQWWGAELQISKQLFKTHHLTLGAEFQDNAKLRLAAYYVVPHFDLLQVETSTSTIGSYVQDEWAITRSLTFNAGLRYDWFETFGGTVNPRGALIWHPWEKTTLKFLYAQAYRAPNAYEFSYANPLFRVNPELQPERVKSYEMVLEQAVTPKLRLSASIFYNQIEGLISEQHDSSTDQLFFDNGGLAETKGGSVELEMKLPKGIKGRASYTLQRTTDATTGERFSNSPDHLAKLNLIVPLYRDKVFSGIELQYTSETENTRHQPTSGYVLANWTFFSRELLKDLEVSAGVHNLFDQKYGFPGGPQHLQDNIPQDGRTFRLKLTYRF